MNVLIPIFSPPKGTWGSLTRVMALAKTYTNKGDTVVFCASGLVFEALISKGFKVYKVPETTILGLPKFLSKLVLKNTSKMTPPSKEGKSFGNIWLLYFFLGYANKKSLCKIVDAQMKIANEFNPDIILTEMELGAYLISHIINKPLVITYSRISLKGIDSFFYKKICNSVEWVLKKYNKPEKINLKEIAFSSKVLKIIPSIPELDTTESSREDICYTGNLLEPVKSSKTKFLPEKGKKYIFCYFGTGSISFELVTKILPKTIKQYKDTICIVASQSIKEDYNIENVHFVNYIQAQDLLPYCYLTICHGGLNTITQSLEAGVPLLVFPGAIFERRFNAEMVETAGGGFFGELSDFTDEWISDKINKLEELKTKSLQSNFLKYNGAETAYTYINSWMAERF